MKITIEMPDTTACAFLNYIYLTDTGMSMGVKQIDSDELRCDDVIVCNSYHLTEEDCGNDD